MPWWTHQYGRAHPRLQLDVLLEQLLQRPVTVGHVMTPGDPRARAGSVLPHDDAQVEERDAVVFVIVGEKGNHRVLVLHLGAEHLHTSAPSARSGGCGKHDMDESFGANVG